MIKINKELLDKVSKLAKASLRLRINYNFHLTADDTLQRLLNAMEPGTYIQPHKHENPDKREAFWAIRGKILVVEFDHQGKITEHCILSPDDGVFGCEITIKGWHSVIPLEENTVAYEVKDGPYNVEIDKQFASWAPDENSFERFAFVQNIFNELNIPIPKEYLK